MPAPNADTLMNRFTVKAKFRHMQVLIKLSELGSMRRAAQAVHMTQPAISQLVSELERLLETDLFFRHARGIEPTEAAKDLIPVARRILKALEDGSESLANRLQDRGGVVRVAASPAALGGMIHGKLDGFAQAHPTIQVHISELGAIADENDFSGDPADIMCSRKPSVIPKDWTFESCAEDMLVAVCGYTHPLAEQPQISSRDLGQYKWLMNRVGSVARDRFEVMSLEHGWPSSAQCPIVMHIPNLTRDMLMTGKYLAIMPRSVCLPWLASGEFKALATEVDTPLAPLGFLWRKATAGEATTKFAGYLRRQTPSG